MIQHIDGMLTETTSLGQSRPGSTGLKGVLHTPHISGTEASPSDTVILSKSLFYGGSLIDYKPCQ